MKTFIYSLLNEKGQVFYIGIAKNPKQRYNSHVSTVNNSMTSKYIKVMRLNGFYPRMNILFYLDEIEARKKEAEIIQLLVHIGQPLTNYQHSSLVYLFAKNEIKDVEYIHTQIEYQITEIKKRL